MRKNKKLLHSYKMNTFKIHLLLFSIVHSFWFRREMRMNVGFGKALQYLNQIGVKVLQSF